MSDLKSIREITTREQLMNALVTGDKVIIVPTYPNEPMAGTIQSVEREDGSGYSFNVVICVKYSRVQRRMMLHTPSQVLKTVYIRFPSRTRLGA